MPHDDRPEHIHMVVCGAGFFSLYVLLRVLHLDHLVASILVLLISIPLMYVLVPVTASLYVLVSKPETRRSNIHVTDAGFSTLVFFFFVLMGIGVLGHLKHRSPQRQNTATQQRR